MKVFVGK